MTAPGRGRRQILGTRAVRPCPPSFQRSRGYLSGVHVALLLTVCGTSATWATEPPLEPSRTAMPLDRQIDWSRAALIVVQDAGRYKTLDSFAREAMNAMGGKEHLPGLSPLASLLEWLFNREAYVDEPVVRIRDRGMRVHLGTLLPAVQRQFVRETGLMTPRQLALPAVRARMAELEPRFEMVSAMRRVRDAQAVAEHIEHLVRIVPSPQGAVDSPWFTPNELIANLPEWYRQQLGAGGQLKGVDLNQPVPGVTPEQAEQVLAQWAVLQRGWRARSAADVQKALDRLAELLPTLAPSGVYPQRAQRLAEAYYYRMGKFTWGWTLYFLGALASVWALVTRWRIPMILSAVALVVALTLHAWGLGLRWFILGRIPVANMFEAVVASAWMGIATAGLAELRYRTRVFLFGGHVAGFMALLMAGYVIPGGGTLTTIMGILDDVMLRIHTVLIIASYALIFIAAVIAVVYLFGYYFRYHARRSALFGLGAALGGLLLIGLAQGMFEPSPANPGVLAKRPLLASGLWLGTVATAALLAALIWMRAPGAVLATGGLMLVVVLTAAIGNHGFVMGMGLVLSGTGLAWAVANGIGLLRAQLAVWGTAPGMAAAGAGPVVGLLPAGLAAGSGGLGLARPLLAGAAPGDEQRRRELPAWMLHCDWSQLIILNLVFVLLFVGIILGAVWADYSWGRPWGWDPKEVFAMNTWLIYIVLIHARFVVREKGLWTAWLSIAGCLMMAFNWCFVNFFIVGLHSYA